MHITPTLMVDDLSTLFGLRLVRSLKGNETTRDAAASRLESLLADVSQKIGYIDAEIEQFVRREQLAQELRELGKKRANVQVHITPLEDRFRPPSLRRRSARVLLWPRRWH